MVAALFHVAISLGALSADLPTHHGATTVPRLTRCDELVRLVVISLESLLPQPLAGAAGGLAAAGMPVLAMPPLADVVHQHAAKASPLRISHVDLGRPGRVRGEECASDVARHMTRLGGLPLPRHRTMLPPRRVWGPDRYAG